MRDRSHHRFPRLLAAGAVRRRLLALVGCCLGAAVPGANAEMILVQGSEGEPEFREIFRDATSAWESAAKEGGVDVSVLLPEGNDQLYRFHMALDAASRQAIDPLWIVLIGHGTYDQRDSKITLDGEDLGSLDLKNRLEEFQRPVFLFALASASGPFILELSAPNRVVVTATKSGREVNFSRFCRYFAEALTAGEADLDNDGQNSVLECFIHASKQTDAFYETQGRIITEHALLDDNGDRRGADARTLAIHYEGLPSGDDVDGLLARQWSLIPSEEERLLDPETRQKRNAIEQQLFLLNQDKSTLEDDAYYEKLEELMIQLARLYHSDREADADPVEVEAPDVEIPESARLPEPGADAETGVDAEEAPPPAVPPAGAPAVPGVEVSPVEEIDVEDDGGR